MKSAVYGLGNVLRRDDGFGPTAVRQLDARYEFPARVVLRDLGTPGLDLASHLVGFGAVLIIDTLRISAPAGTIHVLGREDIEGGAARPRMTDHELDLHAALELAELVGDAPRHVRLVGVVPFDLDSGTGLTPAVESTLDLACERVLRELADFGIVGRRRRTPSSVGAWWQGRSPIVHSVDSC